MPPALACKFTVSELAVLRIVGDEVRQHGHCDRSIDELAARAGVCRSMVKNAIRAAARLGLLTVQERRREGRRNLPNVIRIVSKEWTVWLARGGRSSRPSAEPLHGGGGSGGRRRAGGPAATCPMSSGSSRKNGRSGWPGEGGRAVHQPSR